MVIFYTAKSTLNRTHLAIIFFIFRYASHDGSPWQSCTFSFTVGNVLNGYSGASAKWVDLSRPSNLLLSLIS
jgi:hypothetical protein